ncbi:MAG TPA: DUF1259 domain-containing protein [Alphaproteobacteria bacterium]|nr:DUF1259 domain-containing protein [Alphaproteobacteria bacterium]
MRRTLYIALLLVAACSYAVQKPSAPAGAVSDWKAVDNALGRSGQDQPDGSHKFGMPRSDLSVTVDGLQIKAGFALGSWTAFRKMGTETEVMGDLVLIEDEVAPVMQKLISSGIEITALHNHLLHESPHVMYMHIHGRGDAAKLAGGVHDALALTKTPPPSAAAATVPDLGFDTKQVDAILGHAGKNNNGVYQVAVPRAESISEDGMPIPTSMGLATALNFQPTGGGKAAITGDFVLTGTEVNPVIKALRAGGVSVTALHSHMLDEQPRLFFMHFWANDDAIKLAKALRSALDQTNSAHAK